MSFRKLPKLRASKHREAPPPLEQTDRHAFGGNEMIPCSKDELVWLQHPAIASYDAFLLAGWESPIYIDVSVCKCAQPLVSQPFLSSKMTGSCPTQPATMRFICLPCQKSFQLLPAFVQPEESRTGCNIWVAASPSFVQPLLPEICSVTTGVTLVVFPLKSRNKFAFTLKSSILIPHAASF